MIRDSREERKSIYFDTKKLCKTNSKLIDSIKNSKEKQQLILEEEDVEIDTEKKYKTPAKVVVSKKRTLEAAKQYKNERVCALNFASASNPGGGVESGSNAQEEAICRCSTLHACINDPSITVQFHMRHKSMLKNGNMTALYNDDCIYTPDVTVFKTDTATPVLMPEEEWYQVDIISCAAPNLRSKPSNAMNPNSGDVAVKIKANDLMNLHIKRMKRILDIAKQQGAEVIILGAFGCGAFQNSPDIVAEAMARVIKEYLYDFHTIEFAVFCPPNDMKNYDVFNRRLSRIGK